jgi:hypothetical protein
LPTGYNTINQETALKIKIFVSLLACVILSMACNMPSNTATNPPPATEPAQAASPTLPPPTATATATVEPTATFPPVDVTFSIDCSALDPSRQKDCDTFIANTRDIIYPILREVTGVSLSDCYKNINYKILEGNPSESAGGYSNGFEIVYAKEYSIDTPEKYDAHELLHSISACSGALDEHLMHSIVENAVWRRLGGVALTFIDDKASAQDLLDYQLEAVKTASGDKLSGMCNGILGNSEVIALFDIPQSDVTALYRATIDPHPVSAPNAKLTSIWGKLAPKVQVLLEALEGQYKYPIDAPACGY